MLCYTTLCILCIFNSIPPSFLYNQRFLFIFAQEKNMYLREIVKLRNRKNSHIVYYANALMRAAVPKWLTRAMRGHKLARFGSLPEEEQRYITERVDYYCKFNDQIPLPEDSIALKDFTKKKVRDPARKRNAPNGYVHGAHFYDTYEFTRYYPDRCHISILSGDVRHVPDVPCLCKSRPIKPDDSNRNNILLKLNKVRHFFWVKDPYSWVDKQCRIVFRGNIDMKPKRKKFIEMWGEHPLCDLSAESNMSISEHLRYRYIMSLEGNDVASNLKWVMSSNSIAVMPRPTCETWFMEGKLVPDYHYIEIAPDFTNLMERIEYYEAHPEEAQKIIDHAHEWVAQFQYKTREDLISLMVLDKYMKLTGQI